MKTSMILKRICRRKSSNPEAKCTIAIVKSSYHHMNKLIVTPTTESIYETVIKSIKL